MTTLYEFLTKIYRYGHFTIYEPNRDCLVYESFFKHHSMYKLSKGKDGLLFWDITKKTKYFDNNPYVEPTWHSEKNLDKETKLFLERYGDYEVHSVETCRMRAHSLLKDSKGKVEINWRDEEFDSLGIFICSPDPEHKYYSCDRCTYSKVKEVPEKVCHRGFIQIPDNKCLECRKCSVNKKDEL